MSNNQSEERPSVDNKRLVDIENSIERQKTRLEMFFRVFGTIISMLFALGVFNVVTDRGPRKAIVVQQEALAELLLLEVEQDISEFIRSLTLSSVTDSMRQNLYAIRDRFESSRTLMENQPEFSRIDDILNAIIQTFLKNQPDEAINILNKLELSEKSAKMETLTLVMLGVAHHLKADQTHSRQSYSRKSKEYFDRATKLPIKVGLAYNGLAVQMTLKGLGHMERREVDKALTLFVEAERLFAAASDIDGTLVSYYKYLNNTTYIRATLLGSYLDGLIDQTSLSDHFRIGAEFAQFIDDIDQGYTQAERFSHGSSGAPGTAAECLSITGEYFGSIGNNGEANRRFELSKRKYLEAIDKDLFRGYERGAIERRLDSNRLLRVMLCRNDNRDEIIKHATD
jgi:tetratricopeptide (TPR) repeat protein